jgi:PKD repeat protein
LYYNPDYGTIDLANYGHIGIFLGNNKVVHAFGTVKIQDITEVEGLSDTDSQGNAFEIDSYIGWTYPPNEWLQNQQPVSSFTYSCSQTPIHSGDIVNFDASSSYDPDGEIKSYKWDFGDGATGEGVVITHRFRGAMNESKSYAVNLTVEDDKGAADNVTISVIVNPEQKLVDVSPGHTGVSCWMKITYNWVGLDEATGENLHIISKIEAYSGGFVGAYQLFVLRRISPPPSIHQVAWYMPLPAVPILKTYSTPFEPSTWQELWGIPAEPIRVTFSDGAFEGIGVTDTSLMLIVASGSELPPLLYYDIGVTKFDPVSLIIHLKQEELKELDDLTDVLDLLNDVIGMIFSPGELRIYDSDGHVTGLVNGEVKSDIPGSTYVNGTIVMFRPIENCHYEVIGTSKGSYGLEIISVKNGETTTFVAAEIPITVGATHDYTIDWNALSQGQQGVTIQIDFNGDGKFERTITSYSQLTVDEFWPYSFTDSARGTKLRIDDTNQTFQFIAPDKGFPIKKATRMKIIDFSKEREPPVKYDSSNKKWKLDGKKLDLDNHLKTFAEQHQFNQRPEKIILINHKDSDLQLSAVVMDGKEDSCVAIARDLKTKKVYLLIVKPELKRHPKK